MKKSIVIGIGNNYRRDDGVGLEIAGRIEKMNLGDISVIKSNGDLTGILEEMGEFDKVIIADSVSSGARPGTVYRIVPDDSKYSFRREKKLSSHRFEINEVLRLAQNISKPVKNVIIYGIEGKDYSHGEGLSSEVREAAEKVAAGIIEDLSE
jgi:hydrogenase maturation protease